MSQLPADAFEFIGDDIAQGGVRPLLLVAQDVFLAQVFDFYNGH